MKVREGLLAALLGWADVSGDILVCSEPLHSSHSALLPSAWARWTLDTGHWTPRQHGGGTYYNITTLELGISPWQ